ncbi:glutarate dioxygenase GlaH [Endozoicomonas sp. SCSIO W0465]|uniref:glutarate dioxygenase GlaH n=1 Tax=Endozoicomonas sp. SCSIO W0465 TaxID=2918516 RepID=UPI0021122675|nr:glutarate dioxygenase GlaH [Endozoicomonas sp. SCSIO W0465]
MINPDTITRFEGFSVHNHPRNVRVQVVTLDKSALERFQAASQEWSVQALEYKPFNRFALANELDRACQFQLGSFLRNTVNDRKTGAFLLEPEASVQALFTDTEEQRDEFVKLSTAISHLIGLPNFDAMYGKYYARFTVRNEDDSDSYLRQAHRRMELHNDGTYVNERTDFVLMMKMDEKNMEGGDSLLLHIDDWQDLGKFYNHSLARENIRWSSPPSKNIGYTVDHPIFFEQDADGKPHMLFIDQFAQPRNMEQGLYLYEMGKSLEADTNCSNIRVNVGSMLVVQNHCWLHGRDKFVAHPGLKRELLRQRGHFSR